MEPLRGEEMRNQVGEGRLSRRTVPISPPPVRAVHRLAETPCVVWSEPGDAVVVGSGAAATLVADGTDRFDRIRAGCEALFSTDDIHTGPDPARPRVFGGFAFHDEHGPADPWSGYPGALFVLPRVQVTWSADGAWLTVNDTGHGADDEALDARLERARQRIAGAPEPGPLADPPGVERRTPSPDPTAWRSAVTTALDRINRGDLRKVVLADALHLELSTPLSTPDIFARLGQTYPDCYRVLVTPSGGKTFLGVTPERLVSVRGRTVETGALAGTTGRGDTPDEDEWLARELAADEKNVHEHELVVDAVRDQLGPFSVSVAAGDRRVRRLETVQHLETPIKAELAGDEHVLSLVEALHPTPAVGGLPPGRALATIRETEPFERGWYAAPVGWIDHAGDGTFAVAIRSALATERAATLYAGVGLVADSDPDREWDEVQLKYRPILDALE